MKKQNDIIAQLLKVIVGLSLVVLMLVSCIGIVTTLFIGAWLHTYNAFTSKEKIAEIEVSPLPDEDGLQRFEVKYTQIQGESALVKFIFPNKEVAERLDTKTYTMYGDSFWIETHVAKFPDFLTLINFKSMYKITGIGGDYINDKEIAKNLPSEKRSIYPLNGGVDGVWLWLKENDDNLQFIIDTAYFSRDGDSSPKNDSKTWDVFLTEEGVLVDSSN